MRSIARRVGWWRPRGKPAEVSKENGANAPPVRFFTTLAFAGCLIAASVPPAGASDAVALGSSETIALGRNWGPREAYRGDTFRWVGNDAEITVRGARGEASLRIACEGGPSVGRLDVPVRVLDMAGRQVDHVTCGGKNRPGQLLLPLDGSPAHYVLHVDGGGRRIARESRVLNFRVFSLTDDVRDTAGSDIVDPRGGVRIGDRWYPLERYGGQSFRWLNQDATMVVDSSSDRRASLRLVVEVGPSVGSARTTLALSDASRRTILRRTIGGRTTVDVPVDLRRGASAFTIHVDSRGARVPGDIRILNLRVFSIALR
jgi:hypothetical protein